LAHGPAAPGRGHQRAWKRLPRRLASGRTIFAQILVFDLRMPHVGDATVAN